MSDPLVSVVLFVHAPYAKFLASSLGSILAQSYKALDVIVLGDGSNQVKEALERFKDDSRWSLWGQEGKPFLQAANDRMRECRGKYVATWNSDDIYNIDHVKLLVEALERDPGVGAVFDNMEYFSDASGDGGAAMPGLVVPQDRAKELAAARLTVEDIFTENFMTGPSSVILKAAVDQVGGYDKDIYLNCDLHWFYRIGAYFPVRFVDYIGVRKRVHALNNTAVNPHYEYGLKELDHIRTHYPDVYHRIGKTVFNKKLGRKYFRLGLYYERHGETAKAREMYRRAMVLRKWSLRYSWEYLRSTLNNR